MVVNDDITPTKGVTKSDSPQNDVASQRRRRRLSVSHVVEESPLGQKHQTPASPQERRGFITSSATALSQEELKLSEKESSLSVEEKKEATAKERIRTRRLSVSGRVNHREQENYAKKEQAVKCSAGTFNAQDLLLMGISYGCHKGLKPESPNQDDFFIIRIDDWGLYGVFDGHGPYGHTIANFVQREFPKTLYCPDFLNGDYDTVAKLLREGFDTVEKKLEELKIDVSLSGSTGSVVYHRISKKRLIVAHVGDSRVVLGTKDADGYMKSVNLSEDHKPQDLKEKKRIEASNGIVRQIPGDIPYRVFHRGLNYPGLAMSRAFGDLSGRLCGIISVPDIREHVITENDQFVIIASDGVWEFITSQEAVDIVGKYGRNKMDKACEELCKEAWERWILNEDAQVVDDITCEIIYLQHDA